MMVQCVLRGRKHETVLSNLPQSAAKTLLRGDVIIAKSQKRYRVRYREWNEGDLKVILEAVD